MKRLFTIIIVMAVSILGGASAAGQKAGPESLTFSKTYSVPEMKQDDIYRMVCSWNCADCGVKYVGSFFSGYEGKNYQGNYYGLDFGKSDGDLILFIDLKFRDEEFDVIVREISVFWDNKRKMVSKLSCGDDRVNRNWFWRAHHNVSILDQARLRSAECFNIITASMDEFLKTSPPIELSESN